MQCLSFFQKTNSNGYILKCLIRININGWVLDGGLEHPKELRKLRNDYPLAPDKMKTSNSIWS